MAFSNDIRLPLDRHPIFPRRCVVCGAFDPEGSINVSKRGPWRRGAYLPFFLRRLFGRAVAVAVPACGECRPAYRRVRVFRMLIRFIGSVVLGLCLFVLDRKFGLDAEHDWLGMRAMGVVAVVLAVAIIGPIEYFFPSAFDIAVHADGIDYEFRDRGIADEFAQLNGGSVDD